MDYLYLYPPNDYRLYLEHHGIRGQKWGIRNAEWYPIEAWKYHLSRSPETRIGSSSKSESAKSSSGSKQKPKKESDKSELARYLTNLGLDVAMLATGNPLGAGYLAADLTRGAAAVGSSIKTKKVEKIRAKSQVDKKTGFHVKNSEMTKKEDMYMVNPQFANFDRNTKNNCMLCTTAYDMRQRGYEVSAKKSVSGYQMEDALSWYKNAKLETSVALNKKPGFKTSAKAAFGMNRGVTDKVVSDLLKQGEGARGNLMMVWDKFGSGHSVVYEVENGRVVLRDCQSNRVYKNPNALLGKSLAASYVRLDNREPNYKQIKEAVR